METLQELLSRIEHLADATDGDLAEIEEALVTTFDQIRAGDVEDIAADDVETLTRLRDAIVAVRTEAQKRATEAAERAEAIAKLEADLRPSEEQPAEESGPAVEVPDTIEGIDDTVPAAIEEGAPAEAEAVVASAEEAPATPALPSLGELADRRPGRHAPAITIDSALDRTIRLVATGQDVPWDVFGQAMCDVQESFLGMRGGAIEKVRVGRFDWRDQYDDERRLFDGDNRGNTRKVNALAAAAMRQDSWTDDGQPAGALLASGGFCAPTPAVYDLAQISGAQRPVRDALPSFNADRGGVRFTTPPDLSDILVDQALGAVGEWTNATDTTPGESIKTTQTIPCGQVVEALTKAIYRSVQIGNFQQRAYPEWVSTWMDNVMAAWARKAEGELLDAVAAASTPVTTTQFFGTARDLLPLTVQLAVAERNRQRTDPNMRMRVLIPYWIIGAIQMDIAHEGYRKFDGFVTEGDVRSWYGQAGVNVSFYEDTAAGAGQIVAAQGAGNDLRNLPATVEWYLYHEGAHVFLDGGTLDLGTIRDHDLVELNDMRVFAESWEGHAYRGIFSYKVRSAICSSGAGSLGEDSSNYCGAS